MDKQTPHILIVDDDPHMLGAVGDILKTKGFEPFRALTGSDALAQLEGNYMDVALIDLRLGDMSGLDLMRGIKARFPETECILLTGHATQNSAIDAIQLGAYGYFQKPFDIEQVLLSIQRALEKHEAKEALRESEARFHALIQNAADLIVVIDPEGTVLYASPSSERILGYKAQEFIGKKFHELVHPEDLPLAIESLVSRREIAGTADGSIELRGQHKNGTWRVIEVLGTNLLAEPSVKGIVMNIRDITERKQAELELQHHKEDLELVNRLNELVNRGASLEVLIDTLNNETRWIYSAIACTVSLLSPDGKFLTIQRNTISPTIAKKIEQVIGQPIPQIQVPIQEGGYIKGILQNEKGTITSDPKLIQQWIMEFTESTFITPVLRGLIRKLVPQIFKLLNIGSTLTIPLISANKTIGLLELASAGLFTADDLTRVRNISGQVTAAILQNLDKQALTASEAELRALFASMQDVVMVIDREGVYRKIAPTNPALLIRPADELLGRNLRDEFSAKQAQAFINSIRQVLKTRQTAHIEYALTLGGRLIWFAASISPMDKDNTLWVTRDVTERKRAEDQLRQLSRAVEQSASTIVITDKIGNIEYANPQFTKTTGYSIAEAQGQNPRILKSGYTSSEEYQRMWQKLSAGMEWRGEFHNKRKNGELYWESATISAILNERGEITNFLAVNEDITERKLAEQITRQQAEQLRLLYEASQRLNRTLDLKEIYQTVCDFMSRIASNDGLFISSFDHETKLITCRAYWMDNNWLDVSPFPSILLEEEGKGTQSRVIRSGQPLLINDYQAYLNTSQVVYYVDGETNEVDKEVPPEEEVTRSALIVPLKSEGVVNGVIQVTSYRLNAFTEDQLKFLESLSLHIVSSEKNALLYAQVKAELTERKVVENVLREREEQYRTLVEQLPAIVFIDDANDEGRTLYISPQIETILGFTPQEWQEESPGFWSKQVHPDDLERVHAKYMNCFKGLEPYDAQYRIRASDGRLLWFHDQAVMLRDENGKPHLIHGVMYDITERKQAEESLRESEKRYHDLFEDSPIALLEEDFSAVKQRLDALRQEGVTDFEPYLTAHPQVVAECAQMVKIKSVNKAALKMYRADSKNKMPKDLSQILGADALDNFISQLAKIAGGQFAFNWEGFNHAIDGSQIDVEVNWSVTAGHENDLSKVIVSLQDITERKRSGILVQRQVQELTLLHAIAVHAAAAVNEDDLLAGATELIGQAFYPDNFGFLRLDESEGVLRPHSSYHGQEDTRIKIVPLGKGVTGRVALEGKPLRIADVSKEQEYINIYDPSRSELCVPLKVGGRVVGVINAESRSLDAFSEADERLLTIAANQVATALENIRLFDETRSRVADLELLYESGLVFGQLLSPKNIAIKIIELLDQKMNWHHTAIRSYDPQKNNIQLLAFNQLNLDSLEETSAVEEQLKASVARLGQGLSGWVIQHGQIVRSNDLAHDERYVETVAGMQSGLYVPIKLGERVIGAISIESEKPNAFSEADERLTNTLANQAATALENARLFDETSQRIKELTALHHTGQTLLAARLNSEQIYAAVHQAVAQTMACEAFVIVLDDEERAEYYAVYFFDKGQRFPARRLPRGKGLSGRVISSGETLLLEDTNVETVQATHFGTKESVRSILAVPLRRGSEIVGMLSTQSYQPHAFGESQRVMLETITAQLASALDNANLYQQTQARIHELETLHVISTSLRTIQTVDEALSTILDNTLATLETDSGSIMLHDPLSDELRDVVARGWFTALAETPIKVGEGVAGTVFETGEPYYASEFVGDALPHAYTRDRVPAGWGGVCLPIRSSTEIIGVMFVSVQLPRQINFQQIRVLESLVDMAGAALHRMRLHNETQRRVKEFASLYETSKVLSAEYDLNSLLRVIVDRAKVMLNASTSGMYLYHAESQELELTMDTMPAIPIGSRLALGEGMAGMVAQTRQPLRIDDYSIWAGRSKKYENTSIHAVIEVPMLYAGELIGVLTTIETGDSGRKFTEADERLLSLFASQAAGAINSARHREDTIRYAEELEQRVVERTAEIETTRQRLDLAASAGGIGVWEVNLKDDTVFWDTRMHMIHGTGASDFGNSLDSWWKMFHPEDVKRSRVQFENALQKTGQFMDEYRILLPDGSARSIAAHAIVLYDEDHQPERMIGVNMDITERKQVEQTLHRANLEMERALRTKDEFLANMSHELRTPLNAILGISESLEEQFVGPLNEKQLKYTGIIRESGRHLLELINDILDISKIEAGRMELDLQNISVEKVCKSSLRMIKELAQKKELNVSFEIKGGVKIILGDERRLKQSLVNLLSNAVKFTPRGGAIGLEVNSRPDADEATFTIWDKGVGIAKEDIQYLFKPFVQLDAGLSREYQGTGLGLALVAQMMRLHGGRVHVESELGQGSRFIITLPWTSEQQNAQAKATGELPQLTFKSDRKRKGKILIVEDTDVVITLMSEYLSFKGYKVLIAQNGMEGVQLAKREHPDLIFMDVMMPVMDGLEATRQIRLDSTLQNVPIIALTALAMIGDREICMAAGMNDYMSKPIRMQELADKIEKHLGDGRQAVQAG